MRVGFVRQGRQVRMRLTWREFCCKLDGAG